MSTPGINIGVGTSLLCLLFGHRFFKKVPDWVVKCGCRQCGGKGKVPHRPEGGGPMSSRICEYCGGSGVDPETPLPPDWQWKKRKRKWGGLDQANYRPRARRDRPTHEELVAIHGKPHTWGDCFAVTCKTITGPKEEAPKPAPTPVHRLRKQAVASCTRCGAKNPNFTEPASGWSWLNFGLIGGLLVWILRLFSSRKAAQ